VATAQGAIGVGVVCDLAAAAAVALVNSLGNLGSAVGPALVGPIKQSLGLAPAVATLGVSMALAAAFALALRRR
jgi:energy-converting hydrogenase Eha subunit E